MKEAKDIPRVDTLKYDPILSKEAKNIVGAKGKPLKIEELDSALLSLDNHRKARVLTKGIERALKSIDENEVEKSEMIVRKNFYLKVTQLIREVYFIIQK